MGVVWWMHWIGVWLTILVYTLIVYGVGHEHGWYSGFDYCSKIWRDEWNKLILSAKPE